MKKTTLFILILSLLLSLCACTGTPTTEDPSPVEEGPVSDAPPTASSDTDPITGSDETGLVSFPLDDRIEFTYWISDYDRAWQEYTDLLEHPAFGALAERTNVYAQYTRTSQQALSEQYGLLMASGDYYDVMQMANNNMSQEQLLDNDISIDLTELIPTYMPNYYELVTSDDALRLDVVDSAGRFLMLYGIYDNIPMNWQGLVVRSDVLEENGLELPVTYDDVESCLELFRELGYRRPLNMAMNGSFSDSNLESGFNVGSRLYQDDGAVKYGPMEDGYLEYLTKMNDWYTRELIGQDFPGDGSWGSGQPNEGHLTHEIGYFVINSSSIGSMLRANTDDDDYYLTCVDRPTKADGSSKAWSTVGGSGRTNGATMISTACDEELVPILLQYFDYCYSPEGYELCSFGIEGEHYTKDENGDCHYIPEVIATGGPDLETKMFVYEATFQFHPGYYNDKEVDLGMMRDPAVVAMQQKWAAGGTGFGALPGLIFTAEEAEAYTSKLNDCNTYVEENTVKFIMGERPLSEFDDFREELTRFGIEEVLEIQQAAFNRYFNR